MVTLGSKVRAILYNVINRIYVVDNVKFAYRLRLHRIKITATHARETNRAAAKAAKIITNTLYFFGLSSSDLETLSTDAKVVVAASVGVFFWREEFLTWVLFIDGIKVGLMSVTKGNKKNAKLCLDISKILHFLVKF